MKRNQNKPLRIFAGLSSFETIAMFRRGLFYCYLSIYLKNFLGLSVTETTLFATVPMILNSFFQTFVWGHFSDRYQLRRTLIICGELMGGWGPSWCGIFTKRPKEIFRPVTSSSQALP